MKGLHCSVIGTDCTNGGVTSGRKSVTLVADGVDGPFEPDDRAPEVALIYDLDPQGASAGYLLVANPQWLAKVAGARSVVSEFECFGADWSSRHQIVRVRAVPVIDGKPKGGMFGGNFITTSDSRFPISGPIPVFDRFE